MKLSVQPKLKHNNVRLIRYTYSTRLLSVICVKRFNVPVQVMLIHKPSESHTCKTKQNQNFQKHVAIRFFY